ncbi:hypothetical protein [Paenibacillus nasutitermitis]|uniref:Uncharacterized protein n=1 Tax=Paenibacillus nasutitermitis TaxID=1652958 RepID=A0A917DRB1_9BACL|nr:hypothetical protein [Paenibacillus nasutitermitis]GGD62430.1 hypothetical protein GCM10010911_20400 [Paenibacillus nasutitermitis]
MTARSGQAFETERVLSDVEALLTQPIPTAGPTVSEGETDTGEWTLTRGERFLIIPLWESDDLTGLYEPEWNEAVETAEEYLANLVRELDHRWGTHRKVAMHVPLFRKQAGEPLSPLFQALLDNDCYGDLAVWGPVSARRWVAVSVGHSDGDAPMIMVAAVCDLPITELEEQP